LILAQNMIDVKVNTFLGLESWSVMWVGG